MWVLGKGYLRNLEKKRYKDARSNPKTTRRADGAQKAKAKIVLLGFEHPDLISQDFNTTVPEQSQLMKH